MPLDLNRDFVPCHLAIVTVSDSRTPETDKSGDLLDERATTAGHVVVERSIVTDDAAKLAVTLRALIDRTDVDVVVTTGGTGLTGRDVTPEAFDKVCEKSIPGFGELFRMLSFKTIGTSTIQSRATAGVAKGTYLFALPGSTGACRDAWDGILATQLDIRHRPCNFVELFPRLREHEEPRPRGLESS